MKLTTWMVLAAGAAAALSTPGLADGPVPAGTAVKKVRLVNGELVPAGYSDRAPKTYDAQAGAACATYLGTPHIIDDVNFGPVGPWAGTTNNVLRTISIPVANSLTSPVSFDLRIRIWDDANFANNPMVAPGATPLWQATLRLNNVANGIFDLEVTPTTPPTLPDSTVWVELECFEVGTTTLKPLASATAPSLLWGLNLVTGGPGSSGPSWGRDRDNDGILEGGAVGAPPAEHNQTTFATGTCANQFMNLALFITGDVPATPPAHTALGTLGDTQSRTDALSAGQVTWYSINLNDDVTDALLTFLDIDTAGSGITDTALGLYDSNGDLIASDLNSGPGEAAQLSFGVGRRPGNGDGEQFDGYGGELLATNTYYLAVAAGPTTFDDAFTAASTGTDAGSIRVNFRSNTNGGVLPPSVAPVGADQGTLLAPGAANAPTLPGNANILWYSFTLCADVNGSSAENYLDIDFANSDPSGDADHEAFLFNTAGNVVAASDDEGPNFFPQFSFGDTNIRGPYRPAGQTFAGESGPLAAGTYYLGVGFFDVRPLANAATDGRWHVRPLGGDNLAIAVDFYTGITECGSACPPCAADFNQDGGVDGGDVEAFYVTWETGEGCGDTNQDGGVDGGDVEFFFSQWEAGGC